MKIERRRQPANKMPIPKEKWRRGMKHLYLTIGEYPLIEIKRILIGLCSFNLEDSTDDDNK